VFSEIENGRFGANQDLVDLINTIRNRNDHYLLAADFKAYIEA